MAILEGSIQHLVKTAAQWTSDNTILLVGQFGIESDALTTTPKMKLGDGTTTWSSLPYFGGQSTIPIMNSLFVMSNGNDSTGLIGRLDKPFLTITAAQTAASSGDTIFIFGGQTYTDTGLGKDGITYHYLGAPTHSVSIGVIYEISGGIRVSILGDAVFYNGASAIIRSLSSSSNNILFKCKSIHRNTGGASAVVCNEGTMNVEASEFIYSDTNCATCQNGTLTIKSPKYSGEGSTFAVSGTGTIYSEGEIFVSSTNSSLRSAILMTSAGAIHHKGNITYSNPNSTSAIVDLRTGTGAYVKIEGNITATSYNATYGLIGITGTNGTVDLIGKIIGTETNVLTGSGAVFNKVSFGGGSATWGSITGTLSSQTDLQTALDAKAPIVSPAFTGTVTTPALIVSSEAASTVAIIDSSKNIKSADTATYPSLTELSHVKGVTSTIQTQLNSKKPNVRISGKSYSFPHSGVAAATGWQGGAIYLPYDVYEDHYVTNIGSEVTTAVAATSIRFALYSDNGSGLPGALIEQSGLVASTSTGRKSYSFSSPIFLSATNKRYWMAIQVDSSSTGMRYATGGTTTNVVAGTATATNIYREIRSFGSFPSTAGASSTETVFNYSILINMTVQ